MTTTTIVYAPRTQTAALKEAASWVGKAKTQGWCQAWVVVDIFGTGGVGDYDGDKAADAEDGWKKAVAKGKVVYAKDIPDVNNLPGGYMAYWSGGSHDNGHAAVTAEKGSGQIYSTDLNAGKARYGKVGKTSIHTPHDVWGLTFLGYVTVEGNGHALTDRPGTAPKPPVADWSHPETFVLGATGDQVTRLGERLIVWAKALKLPAPYKEGPGPTFTVTDQQAVKAFQKAQGWTGANADGFPGPMTLSLLAVDPKTLTVPAKPVTLRPANKTAPKALPTSMVKMFHVPAGTMYAVEDSIPGMAAAVAGKFRWSDMDCHVTKDKVVVFGHWSNMVKDGYTLPAAFTKKYGKSPVIENVLWADLQTLRTPVTTVNGVKQAIQYVDAKTAFEWLAKHPTLSIAMEMKGTGNALSPGFEDPAVFKKLHEDAIAAGIDPSTRLLIMAQAPWSNLLPVFKAAHPYFRTAIQRLDWKKPTNYAAMSPFIDYYRSGQWGTKTR